MQLHSLARTAAAEQGAATVGPPGCLLQGRPLGELFDNQDLVNSYKDTLVVTTDGQKFRSSRLLLAAASPWLRSLLLSVQDLAAEPNSSTTEAGAAEVVIVFDGYSSSLVHDALLCLEEGRLVAATASERLQSLRNSEADILDFFLASENFIGDELPSRKKKNPSLMSCSVLIPRVMNTYSIPLSSAVDRDSNVLGEDMSVDIIVKCEPDALPEMDMDSEAFNGGGDDDDGQPTENGAAKVKPRTRPTATPSLLRNIWSMPDTEYKPESEIKKERVPLRRGRRPMAKGPPSKADWIKALPVGLLVASWREKQLEKVKMKEEELRSKYRCQPCDRGFTKKSLLEQHREVVHHVPAQQCPHCPRSFSENRQLQSHLLHHGKQGLLKFKCDVCGIGFVSEEHLKTHKEIQGLCKKNKCSGCSAVLASYQELKAHRVKEHGGLEERKCFLCTETFLTLQEKRDHQIVVHQLSREYICALCGRDYCSQASLNVHMLENHDATADAPAKCEICQRKFKNQKKLHEHNIWFHGDAIPCELCGKTFKNKKSLRLHKGTVHMPDSEKPYRCNICSKGFYTAQVLRAHTNIHLDARPYRCRFCSQGFNNHSNKSNHQRRCKEKLAPANSGSSEDPSFVSQKSPADI